MGMRAMFCSGKNLLNSLAGKGYFERLPLMFDSDLKMGLPLMFDSSLPLMFDSGYPSCLTVKTHLATAWLKDQRGPI
jgi:hypothetical protein